MLNHFTDKVKSRLHATENFRPNSRRGFHDDREALYFSILKDKFRWHRLPSAIMFRFEYMRSIYESIAASSIHAG